ncbi:hypothetical protein ACXJJ3_26725 [Kribbella sp. WER1]
MSKLHQVSEQQLADAFTEWERRYREEPERFMAEARRLLKTTPESYGEACAPYLLAILAEQAGETETVPAPSPQAE